MSAKIAKRTRGVNAVLNQLIVVASDRSDDDIRGDVEKVLRLNDSVDKPRIAVDVSRGKVALTGKVASLAEKRIAELAASGVTGVTGVENQITVGLSSDRTNEDIAEEIRGLIVHSVYLDDASRRHATAASPTYTRIGKSQGTTEHGHLGRSVPMASQRHRSHLA